MCQPGHEQYLHIRRNNRTFYSYEYRSPLTGNLFTTQAVSLAQCRERRDAFLENEEVTDTIPEQGLALLYAITTKSRHHDRT